MERQQEENGGVQQASGQTCGLAGHEEINIVTPRRLVVVPVVKACSNTTKAEETQTGLVQRSTGGARKIGMTHWETASFCREIFNVLTLFACTPLPAGALSI